MEVVDKNGNIVLVYDNHYVVFGGTVVNEAPEDTEWQDGIDTDTIEDLDCFTWGSPIESLDELITAVEY